MGIGLCTGPWLCQPKCHREASESPEIPPLQRLLMHNAEWQIRWSVLRDTVQVILYQISNDVLVLCVSTFCLMFFSVPVSSPQGPLAYHYQCAGWLARGWHCGAPVPRRATKSGCWGAQLCNRGEREALSAHLPGERLCQAPQQRDNNVKKINHTRGKWAPC